MPDFPCAVTRCPQVHRSAESSSERSNSLAIVVPVTLAQRVSRVQLFFFLCAMKPENCGTTFVSAHAGRIGLVFSRSEIVIVSSNGFLHLSQRNS